MKKTKTFLVWSILCLAVCFDARSYRIPNQLIVLGYLAGIYINLLDYGLIGIVYFIAKALWPVVGLSLLFLMGRQIGAGDIKLFSVMATMMSIESVIEVMVISVIVAAVVIFVLSLKEKQLIKRKLHYSFYMTAAFFLLQYK